MTDAELTERGFRVFGHVDARGGETVRVQESSRAGEGPHVWLFVRAGGDSIGLELTYLEALKLKRLLQAFIEEASAGMLTEKFP